MGKDKSWKLLLYYKVSTIRTRSEGHNSWASVFFFLTKWVWLLYHTHYSLLMKLKGSPVGHHWVSLARRLLDRAECWFLPRFCLSFDCHSLVRPRHLVPRCVGSWRHVKRLCLLYWENTLAHSFFFPFWSRFFWFEYRQLHCVNVCGSAFFFSVQIYLLKEKHICIKKSQNTGRMSTLFFFL